MSEKASRERWIFIVNPVLWDKFSTLLGLEWIKWNMKHEAGRNFTKKINWATLFGYVCWDIWVARCKKLFGDNSEIEFHNAHSTLFRASWDMDLTSNCQFYAYSAIADGGVVRRQPGFITLETDGFVLESGQSECAGAIKGEDGGGICGYMSKLTRVPPMVAEVIAIIQDL